MTLPLIWPPEARHDLLDFAGYIADRKPAAADRTATAIEVLAVHARQHYP